VFDHKDSAGDVFYRQVTHGIVFLKGRCARHINMEMGSGIIEKDVIDSKDEEK